MAYHKTRKVRKSRKARRSTRQKQRGGDPKTVMKHISAFEKSTSHPGCFFSPNDDIETDNKVLIVGPRYPKQTDPDYKSAKYPYEECLFFFNMDFPRAYPGVPPHMQFVNSAFYGDNFRYHPNLYQVFPQKEFNGKVCLSILGTWAGPGWTPDMNIESVLTTVQSLLGPNPIHNEPGFEALKQDDPQVIAYNHKVCHRSIKFTVDTYKRVFEEEDMLPPNIEPFVDQLKERAFTAMKFFARKLALLKKQVPVGTSFVREIHHEAMRVDYDSLLSEVLAFMPTIPEEFAKNLAAENTSVKSENDARKQEQAAALAARLAEKGYAGKNALGLTAEKYSLNQQIKEKEEYIRAFAASGDNTRNLERELDKLKKNRAKLNAPAAAPASSGAAAPAPAAAPKKNNNSENNAGNNTNYKYNDENEYEYEEEE